MTSPEGDKRNPFHFDRHSPDYIDHVSEITHQLHTRCPIAWTETYGGHWVASGYEEVFEIARNATLLSNDNDVKGERKGYQGITIPGQPGRDSRVGFLEMDPPEQRDYRRALDPYLSPAAVARWKPLTAADRCGYDYAWVVEHHFLEEYSHSPAPESFLAAASQRTKQIRLGHGIFQLTTNHPARVAERVAVLDLLSNGRCEFGMGESASITELTPFGRDMETKREVFEEAVQAIFPMFTKIGTEHHGKYFDIPLRNVVPKPVQKPHPPLWMACSQLPTIERAGQNGFGALGFQFVSADAAHAWVHAYYNAITKRLKKLADYEINPNMALVSFFMCAKTDEEARRRADGATFFQFALRYYGQGQNRARPAPGTVNMWDEYNKWKRENPEAQEAALRGGLIGSPETIAKKLRRFRASHIDQVILLNQAGKNTHEHICESLELFAREVMPEFRHDPEHEEWKKGVMSGAIQLEEIDTAAFTDRYGKLAVSVSPQKVAAG